MVALAKQSEEWTLRTAADIYTTIFRGLPELLTLFIVYFGLQIGIQQAAKALGFETGVEINSFLAGVIALALVFSSYASEVFLSAFRAIPKGQYEGGYALGLRRGTVMRKIVLPQLIRIALPGLGNLWMILLKDTALVSAIGLTDILRQTGVAARVTKEAFLFFGIAFLLYLVLALLSSIVLNRIEAMARRGEQDERTVATQYAPAQPAPARPRQALDEGACHRNVLMLFWIAAAIGLVSISMTPGISTRSSATVRNSFPGCRHADAGRPVDRHRRDLSLPVALGPHVEKSADPVGLAFAYVYIFRGTPLLAQLFLIYYGLGSFREQLEAVGSGCSSATPGTAPCSPSRSTRPPTRQRSCAAPSRACRAASGKAPQRLGLNRIQTFRKIILPQALIVALRPYGNEIILMIKGSAIVALVTVFDLMGETRRAFSRTYDFQAYIWAAVFYFAMVEALRNVWNWLEARLTRHLKR
jgi:polar amino acid transport system permease protein